MWVHYSHIKTIGGAVAPPAPPVPTPLYYDLTVEYKYIHTG